MAAARNRDGDSDGLPALWNRPDTGRAWDRSRRTGDILLTYRWRAIKSGQQGALVAAFLVATDNLIVLTSRRRTRGPKLLPPWQFSLRCWR